MLHNGPKSLVDAASKIIDEARNPEFVVPEGIEKEGVAHFMGAAAAAHKSGQKKFNFGGKVYPVQIKPHIAKKVNEEAEDLEEMGPGKIPRIDKKVENEYGDKLMKDFLAKGGSVKQVKSPALPKNRNRMVARGSLASGERTITRSGGKSFTSRMGEEQDTPGNGYEHQCAVHVKHSKLGEGKTIFSQHAEPDDEGNIEWYDVMFEHGIEKHVPTIDLEILVSESHMSHRKKKMNEEEELDEGRGRPRKNPPKPSADDEYGPDTGPEADQNIVNHLKKSVDTKGEHDVKFGDGSSHKVPHHVAHNVLSAMGKLKPTDRLEVQKHVGQSHKNLMDVHRMIK